MRLRDRVAIVTGASRGIGKSIALAYASEGARVVATSRTSSDLEQLVNQITGHGGSAVSIAGDVSSYADVKKVVEGAMKNFARVDILVNNAGVPGTQKSLEEIAEWDEVMDVNVKGYFLFAREVLPHMIKQGSGNIINVSSGAGERHEAKVVRSIPYGVSKFAVEGLTYTLAIRMAGSGINVNAIKPGPIRTAFHSSTPVDQLQQIATQTGGLHEPEFVNPLAVYLAALSPNELTGASLGASEWNRSHQGPWTLGIQAGDERK